MNGARRSCPDALREVILHRQRYRCLYCGVIFGSVLKRRSRTLITSPVWDHRVPFAYLGSNPTGNWRAACATCNSIKSDLMFINLVAIRRHMRIKWAEKRIELVWTPVVSSEQEPNQWAVEFSRYMSSLMDSVETDEDGVQYVARKSGARIVLDDIDEPATLPARPGRDSLEVSDWLQDEGAA